MTDQGRKEGAVAQDAAPASESTNTELSDRELEGVAGGTRWRQRDDGRWEYRTSNGWVLPW